MQRRRISNTIPDPVTIILRTMGEDICAARKVRRITQAELARAVCVSRKTVGAMERGDPAVSLGTYAMVAWIMSLESHLLEIFDPLKDPVYQREARLNLPERVREKLSPLGDLDF